MYKMTLCMSYALFVEQHKTPSYSSDQQEGEPAASPLQKSRSEGSTAIAALNMSTSSKMWQGWNW